MHVHRCIADNIVKKEEVRVPKNVVLRYGLGNVRKP